LRVVSTHQRGLYGPFDDGRAGAREHGDQPRRSRLPEFLRLTPRSFATGRPGIVKPEKKDRKALRQSGEAGGTERSVDENAKLFPKITQLLGYLRARQGEAKFDRMFVLKHARRQQCHIAFLS